jgi:phosphocarrier protein
LVSSRGSGRKSLTDLTRQVKIVNELGLHARAAAKIAKLAQKARSTVWISAGDDPADASSVIDILSLACPKGSSLTIFVDDPSDRDILEAIVELVKDGFEE